MPKQNDSLITFKKKFRWDNYHVPAVIPEITKVKGDNESDPDPLLALSGTLHANVTDISERHDDYIAAALLAELKQSDD